MAAPDPLGINIRGKMTQGRRLRVVDDKDIVIRVKLAGIGQIVGEIPLPGLFLVDFFILKASLNN